MLGDQKVLALIPARGGSKRLPRKNLLPLAGKPLINWSIDAALECQFVDRVLVSTDDVEIAAIATGKGVEVPELRPAHLSSDTASSQDVAKYALDKFGADADILVLLQPTSPLRTSAHLEEALNLFASKNAQSVVSVTPCEHSPLWANTLPEDMNMGAFIRPEALKRAQDLPAYYRLNGAIYIYDIKAILENGGLFYNQYSYAYWMNNQDSVDIDTSLDFEFAQFLLTRS